MMNSRKMSILSALSYGCSAASKHAFFLAKAVLVNGFVTILMMLLGGTIFTMGYTITSRVLAQSALKTSSMAVIGLSAVVMAAALYGMFYVVLMLSKGMIHIACDLYDKGHSSISRMFVADNVVHKMMVACALMTLGSAVIIGIPVFALIKLLPIEQIQQGVQVALSTETVAMICGLLFIILAVLICFMFIAVRSLLFIFCLVNNPYMGIMQLLRMSYALTRGYTLRLMGLFVTILAFSFLVSSLSFFLPQWTYSLVVNVMTWMGVVVFILAQAYMYRHLTGGKPGVDECAHVSEPAVQ